MRKGKKQDLVKLGFILLTVLLLGSARSYALEDGNKALIDEMRQVKKEKAPNATQVNLDEVVVKHIPIGTTKEDAMKVCQQNGFEVFTSKDMKRSEHPDFEEYIFCTQKKNRWFLLGEGEYRVILYLKDGRVGAMQGRYFFHSL
ncbi:MAG: hypothetical protein HY807_02895 [Nitrospirae bacterium]|nr:hypothetical protein [Nitrospirota bacterium]